MTIASQSTSELLRAAASRIFLSNGVGGRNAFVSGLSDMVVLRVEADNVSKIYIMITERSSNRSRMIDAWDYPLDTGGRATNLVSWGWDLEHLKIFIIFPTAQAACDFRRAVLGINFDWLAEQDDDTLARLDGELDFIHFYTNS